MKTRDIEKIRAAGLITGEQRNAIVVHFQLKDEGGKFLSVVFLLGGILIAGGIALLVSAHWDDIPRGLKIAIGLGLMLGAQGAGGWLRRARQKYAQLGEALQFLGSALFLVNIALVGQVYHLEGRLADTFLIWMLGLAPLPWLLRSRVQFVLFLAAFFIWFGCKINQPDSRMYFCGEIEVLAFALLGLNLIGAGYLLQRTSFLDFAPVAEKAGALGLLLSAYPLTCAGFFSGVQPDAQTCPWLLPGLAGLGIVLAAAGTRNLTGLTRQWRLTWACALAAVAGLLCAAFYMTGEESKHVYRGLNAINGAAVIALFIFCLLQIQMGLQQRSPFLVNLGMTFIALDILSAYFGLFGTMAWTGLMFVLSGTFLIAFGVALEKRRRALMRRIQSSPTPGNI